jgi:hypothetical protein
MRPCLFSFAIRMTHTPGSLTVGLQWRSDPFGYTLTAGSGLISVVGWLLARSMRAAYVRRHGAHGETER